MKKQRQFSGTSKSRNFYDRKVRGEGFSRVIAVTKLIPKEWRYVRITIIAANKTKVRLDVEKLLGAEINARHNPTDKTGEQNTP